MPKDGDDLNVDEPPKQAEGPVPPETALLGGRHGPPLIEDPFHRALGKSVQELCASPIVTNATSVVANLRSALSRRRRSRAISACSPVSRPIFSPVASRPARLRRGTGATR